MTRAQRDAQRRRDKLMRRRRRQGWTYQEIADQFGVTRQRAWQIVAKAKA